MAFTSAISQGFLDTVGTFLKIGEVLVITRYAYGAGSRDFTILDSLAEFEGLLSKLKSRDSVAVTDSFEMVKAGTIDQTFIAEADQMFHEEACWLLIGPDNFEHTRDWADPDSRSELLEELNDRMGNYVRIIVEPDYMNEGVCLHGYVPDEDGVVRPGAY